MKNTLLASLIMLSIPAYALAYTPAQLTHFETTGSCPGCDLTSTNISVHKGVTTPYNLAKANISDSNYSIRNNSGSDFSNLIGTNTDFSGVTVSYSY